MTDEAKPESGLGERPPGDVAAYARELQEQLRRLPQDDPDQWQDFVDRGLSEAYARGDTLGLVAMVLVVMSFLDVAGRHEAKVAQIDHALNIASDDPNAVPILYGWRGCSLAMLGRNDEAAEAARAADHALVGATIAAAIAKTECHTAAIRLFGLADVGLETVDRLVHARPTDPSADGDSLFVSSVHIPFLYACGRHSAAEPRQRAFRLAARAAKHEFRLADAAVFHAAERMVADPLGFERPEPILRLTWLARWRAAVLNFRAECLGASQHGAAAALEHLLESRSDAGDADLDPSDTFRAHHCLQFNPADSTVTIEPPPSAHLLNLPSILAGGEAVAVGGSQALAMRWLTWLGEHLPPHIETSLEWPVSRVRIEALLALRCADLHRADGLLERAAVWAELAGYPCELAIARVQRAELHVHHAPNPSQVRAEIRAQQKHGWQWLRDHGVDPERFGYQVARLSAWTRDQYLQARLTPRELEVLALLAEGFSYKQIGDRLGIKWATVQVLAHRCYEKLDASGKAAAVKTAREQGIL